MTRTHPKIEAALVRYGYDRFVYDCEALLGRNPSCKVVLGLLGGASTGNYSAGKTYPRFAARYEREGGYVGIKKHAGPYLYVAL